MAVYERAYRAYTGALTPQWSRFLILPRYSLATVLRSRLFLVFGVLSLIAPLGALATVYVRHNAKILELMTQVFGSVPQLEIGAVFFDRVFLGVQGSFAFALALVIGPALISPDKRNNALCLYFSRPLTRPEYVLGKFVVLAVLLSAITWVPGLLVYALQCYFEGWEWTTQNLRIGVAIFLSSWIWTFLLSLIALAVSAWVKWKPLARLLFLGAFFVLQAFGGMINLVYGTTMGNLLKLFTLQRSIRATLFGLEPVSGVPPMAPWVIVTTICLLSIWALMSKLKPYGVVK